MMVFTIAAGSDLPCGIILVAVFAAMVIVALLLEVGRSKLARNAMDRVRSQTDFRAADVYVSPLDQNGLAIESTTGRLMLIHGKRQQVIPASNIVSVEIMADDASVVRTNRDSQVAAAAIGGLLLGPVGLLMGGVTGSKRSEARIKRLVLRIVTTDFATPNHDILIHKSNSSKGDAKTSILLREPVRVAETWHSRITVLIRNEAAKVPMVHSTDGPSVADEVRKLDALRREGILTENEFQWQKERLLANTDSVSPP